VAITTANVTTANITTAVIGTETVTTSTITTANVTTANITTANITTDNISTGNVSTSLTLSYGTANAVAYLNGSKVLTTGSALTFDGTNFATTGTATATKLIPTGSSATGNGLYLPAANSVGISTNGTNAVYIDSTQNVGIGTSSPNRKLEVSGTPLSVGGNATGVLVSVINTGVAYNASPTSAISLWNKFNNAGSTFPSAVLQAGKENATDGNYAGYMSFITVDSVGLSTERMRIDSSGNLLIGRTTGTNANLDVYESESSDATIRVGNVQNAAVVALGKQGVSSYGATSAADAFLYADGPMSIMSDAGAGIIKFSTGGNTERMRLDSSGNLLVGTTAQIQSGKQTISYNASTNNGLVLSDSNNTTSGRFISFNLAGTAIGSVERVAATSAVVYNTTSDYRLKTVTSAVTGQGARIDALKPIDYLWKEGNVPARGFLAHEFQEVYANSVTGTKDAVDADGNPVHQSMQAGTSEVIADLVAEIQSLRKRLTALESKEIS